MSERASVFDSADFDLSGFEPKKNPAKAETPAEEVRAVSEASSFRSREPVATKKKEAHKREPRRYRTGRNIQLNIKVSAETMAIFYDIADRKGWVLGETPPTQ